MPEGLGPWPTLVGAASVFLWLVRLVISYQTTIGERYGKEIERLDAELIAARAVEIDLRSRIEALEAGQHELRYLRQAARKAGIFNPWSDGVQGMSESEHE